VGSSHGQPHRPLLLCWPGWSAWMRYCAMTRAVNSLSIMVQVADCHRCVVAFPTVFGIRMLVNCVLTPSTLHHMCRA
jgi:hypothetical protein